MNWPELFMENPDLDGVVSWREVSRGCWIGEAPDAQAVCVVLGGDDQPTVSIISMRTTAAGAPSPMEWLRLHDRLADLLRDSGWQVGCAGPDCEYPERWPCPVREHWANPHPMVVDRPEDGHLHVPTVLS